MEQITFEAFTPPETQIREALAAEINDAEYLKYLNVSENKDGSISVKAKSFLVVKIYLCKSIPYMEVRTKKTDIFSGYEIEAYDKDLSRVRINGIEDVLSLKTQISTLFMITLSEMGGESFGCCHRYEACSDARKCIHPNLMMSLACSYRKNLESGRIFYGKNKNT